VTPVDFESMSGPVSLGDAGLVTANPSDLGTVLPGNGGLGPDGTTGPATGLGDGNQKRGGGGGSRNAGAPGAALFFGTKAKGNRFVFVIDNSSSMKGGRLEMALAELVKTVESLTPRQSFYVIFVSDQTYPMFMVNPPFQRGRGLFLRVLNCSQSASIGSLVPAMGPSGATSI
jgi:hypothetical protein